MDLIRCLRAKRPNLPVVIMTGRTLERGALDEFRGPTMCISKPISDAQLFNALRSLLALSTTSLENRAVTPQAVTPHHRSASAGA